MIRAVLDTNVIVSGVLNPEGGPGKVLQAALEGQRFQMVTSLPILAEVGEVLRRPRIARRHGAVERDIALLLVRLFSVSLVTEGTMSPEVVVEDPTDNMFLAAATEGDAGYIVSGDRHLLQLGGYEGVIILSPVKFLDVLSRES